MRRILDANYENSDLNKFRPEKFQHLPTKERDKLLNFLRRLKYMFNVTLGKCDNTLVGL